MNSMPSKGSSHAGEIIAHGDIMNQTIDLLTVMGMGSPRSFLAKWLVILLKWKWKNHVASGCKSCTLLMSYGRKVMDNLAGNFPPPFSSSFCYSPGFWEENAGANGVNGITVA